jgi:hypothetical protein
MGIIRSHHPRRITISTNQNSIPVLPYSYQPYFLQNPKKSIYYSISPSNAVLNTQTLLFRPPFLTTMKLIHLTAPILLLALTNALPLGSSIAVRLKERQCTDVAEGCPPPWLDPYIIYTLPDPSNDTDWTPPVPPFIYTQPDPSNDTNWTPPVPPFNPITNITWPFTDPGDDMDWDPVVHRSEE